MNIAAPGLFCSIFANRDEDLEIKIIETLTEMLSELEKKKNFIPLWEFEGGAILNYLQI
jgi:hypothetical protein